MKVNEHNRLVCKERLLVYGVAAVSEVETTDVENFNGILRERLGRLVRKTKCFVKVQRRLVCSIELFRFYWNFIKEFVRGKSSGLIEGLADHVWTWPEFLHKTLTIMN
jgi:hypothetical protein